MEKGGLYALMTGLDAGLAIPVRDRAQAEIIFQLLVYPMLNDCNVAPASDTLPETIFWTRENNLIGWRSHLVCEPGSEVIFCYVKIIENYPFFIVSQVRQ